MALLSKDQGATMSEMALVITLLLAVGAPMIRLLGIGSGDQFCQVGAPIKADAAHNVDDSFEYHYYHFPDGTYRCVPASSCFPVPPGGDCDPESGGGN